MKFIWPTMIVMVSVSLVGLCQTNQKLPVRKTDMIRQKTLERCQGNPDSLYDRKKVLRRLAEVLNASAPRFRKYESRGFYVQDERPQQFFVFDLTDPLNKSTPSSGCINFLNNHIYHFAARYIPFSLSHVAIFESGRLKLFKAINCENSKDSVDDIIKYVESRPNLNDKAEIIQRVKDYRKYGEYFTVDDLVIRCKQVGMVRRAVSPIRKSHAKSSRVELPYLTEGGSPVLVVSCSASMRRMEMLTRGQQIPNHFIISLADRPHQLDVPAKSPV